MDWRTPGPHTFILSVLEAGGPRPRHLQTDAEDLRHGHRRLLPVSSPGGREGAVWGPTHVTSSPPTGPASDTVTLGVQLQHVNVGGTDTQSAAAEVQLAAHTRRISVMPHHIQAALGQRSLKVRF